MSYFPSEMPAPEPTMDDAEFWSGCADRKLRFQGCADCRRLRHPPTPICGGCHSTRVEWIEAPSQASIYSFTVVHHASHPAVSSRLPYVVAVLQFDGLPGVRFVTNVTDVDPAEVHIGMEVTVWWDQVASGDSPTELVFIPRFRPSSMVGT